MRISDWSSDVCSSDLFDIDVAATQKLVRNLQDTGIGLQVCDSVRQAVRGADIVTTVTAEHIHAKVLEADMLESGMHVNAVGGDCQGKTELDPEDRKSTSLNSSH